MHRINRCKARSRVMPKPMPTCCQEVPQIDSVPQVACKEHPQCVRPQEREVDLPEEELRGTQTAVRRGETSDTAPRS